MASLIQRPRRLRYNKILREMVQETVVLRQQLIYPLFVKEGIKDKVPIGSMPGIYQLGLKDIVSEAVDCWKKGIRAIILFGIPTKKDAQASGAYDRNGIVQQVVKAIKDKCPELLVITDVCLCEYMDHGHCGIVNQNGIVLNDPSLELLAKTALSHAEAGANMVAPSDMMDGRVGTIRRALDELGYSKIPIMSYAVKYSSHFYGPFRDAAESTPEFGDRKSYQMDFANARDALREAKLDEEEGADIIMVKPALPYLDIITRVSEQTNLPVAAYQVSGEYAMITAAVKNGWLDGDQVILESLTAIKRAGAQLITTYFAKEIVNKLT